MVHPMKRKWVQKASGVALFLLRGVFRLLPHGVALWIGGGCGALLFHSYRRRRELALANLRLAFPEQSEREKTSIALASFRHFGRVSAEFLRMPLLSKQQIAGMVSVERLHVLDDAIKGGKGAILITAHFGNWELMARHLADLGYPLSVVARDANDSRTTDIVNSIRTENGYKVFSRGNAARYMLGCLKKNEFVGILPDQNAGDVFVEFFGQPCGSVTGPAVIHLRTGAPIIPTFCVRVKNRYVLEVGEPLQVVTNDVGAIMQQVQKSVEDAIRKHPEQWLWFHDRWKSARRRAEQARPPLTEART